MKTVNVCKAIFYSLLRLSRRACKSASASEIGVFAPLPPVAGTPPPPPPPPAAATAACGFNPAATDKEPEAYKYYLLKEKLLDLYI